MPFFQLINNKNIYTQSGSTSLQSAWAFKTTDEKTAAHTINRILLSVDVDANTESIQIIKQICAVKFWGQHIFRKKGSFPFLLNHNYGCLIKNNNKNTCSITPLSTEQVFPLSNNVQKDSWSWKSQRQSE